MIESFGPNATASSWSDCPKKTAVSGVVIDTRAASNPTPTYAIVVATGVPRLLVVTVTGCG